MGDTAREPAACCSVCARPSATPIGNPETCFSDPTVGATNASKYHIFCDDCAEVVGKTYLEKCCPKCHPTFYLDLQKRNLFIPSGRWVYNGGRKEVLQVWADALSKKGTSGSKTGGKWMKFTQRREKCTQQLTLNDADPFHLKSPQRVPFMPKKWKRVTIKV